MPNIPAVHHRRSIRLKGYDYAQTGAYFVTLVTPGRECFFGDVVNDEMQLNDAGQIIAAAWEWLADQYPHVELDEWVVMPNHLHGIIIIVDDDGRGGSRSAQGDSRIAPTPKRKPLGRLIGAFKTVSSKRINELRDTPGLPVWQRNYFEHIIRNERELDRVREYIANNPLKWALDSEHPDAKR